MTSDVAPADRLGFLAGGGEAAAMIRRRDWRGHPLGPPSGWSPELRTALSLVLNSPESMILAWGPDLTFFFNDAYAPLLGPRRDRAMGARFDEVWADAMAQARPILDAAMAGRPERFADVPWRLATDRGAADTWWSFSYSRVLDRDGRIAGVFILTSETTERVLTDRALARSQEELAAALDELRALNHDLEDRVDERTRQRDLLARIFEETDSFVHVLDTRYRWLAINRAAADEFERVFGRRPQLGFSMLDLLAHLPQHHDRAARLWGRALAGEEFSTLVTFDAGGACGTRSYEMRFNALRDAEGGQVGVVQIVADVTGRERAAEELAHTQDVLRQSQKLEAIGQLTGGVAHDFNNLLTVIRGSVDLLRRPSLSDERRARYIDAIADTAERATRLTNQLLAFARRQTLNPETFDVAASLDAVAGIVRTLVGERVVVAVDRPDAPMFVHADRSQFDTAIVNMAVNARDAMDGEGRLDIAIDRTGRMPAVRAHEAVDGDFITIALTDTGTGIPAAALERVFEPFYTSKGPNAGTGLGLSQVMGFTKQSGGEVVVESREGVGTTFTLYLPRVAPPALADAADGRAAHGGEAAAGGCVLVVEDNADVGTFARQALAELGYASALAVDAAEALALIAADPTGFDVVFSDVMMPGISGIDLARRLRIEHPALPVLLTSGYSSALAAEGSDGFDLLRKPYSLDELRAAIRRAAATRR